MSTRVLHVFGRTDRGGAETFIMNAYRNMDRSKLQFDFMVHRLLIRATNWRNRIIRNEALYY